MAQADLIILKIDKVASFVKNQISINDFELRNISELFILKLFSLKL